jgi:hypothetical protein
MPTAEASQWVEATAPKVPRISGRVVKAAIVDLGAGQASWHRFDQPRLRRKAQPIAIGALRPI